jgi:nucleotide-binding universal stress UspA family protein
MTGIVLCVRTLRVSLPSKMADIPGVVHIEHEHAYKAIIDTAHDRGCDAIQMASHGRRGISWPLLPQLQAH